MGSPEPTSPPLGLRSAAQSVWVLHDQGPRRPAKKGVSRGELANQGTHTREVGWPHKLPGPPGRCSSEPQASRTITPTQDPQGRVLTSGGPSKGPFLPGGVGPAGWCHFRDKGPGENGARPPPAVPWGEPSISANTPRHAPLSEAEGAGLTPSLTPGGNRSSSKHRRCLRDPRGCVPAPCPGVSNYGAAARSRIF